MFDERAVFEVEPVMDLALVDRNEVHIYRRKLKYLCRNEIILFLCPVLISELTFGDFSEYVITRRHIKTSKYISISQYEKMSLSLMHLFFVKIIL